MNSRSVLFGNIRKLGTMKSLSKAIKEFKFLSFHLRRIDLKNETILDEAPGNLIIFRTANMISKFPQFPINA